MTDREGQMQAILDADKSVRLALLESSKCIIGTIILISTGGLVTVLSRIGSCKSNFGELLYRISLLLFIASVMLMFVSIIIDYLKIERMKVDLEKDIEEFRKEKIKFESIKYICKPRNGKAQKCLATLSITSIFLGVIIACVGFFIN